MRWLRPEQIAAQLRHRVGVRLERPSMRPAPPFPGVRWTPASAWLVPGSQRNPADALAGGEFVFLNRSEALGMPPRSWEPAGLPRLWVYNLHYFEWLWALPFREGAAAVSDWIARHPLARGATGWEPYPTSLRLENWCAYFFDRHRDETLADPEFCERLWGSIFRQAERLAARPEHHLRGNHLFENAGALAFAGACFEGENGARWLRRGVGLLDRELPEQVLADGGHFERSPLYQARVAWVLRALRWTGDAALCERVEAPLERVLAALAHLSHPDGDIALFNDAAFGIACTPGDLGAPEPPPGAFALAETGYFGARGVAGHYVVCDAAPIGPDYVPGHAHGDLLSFELSFAGRRVVVDTGVHDYEISETRRICRSTAAHNTVEIDGQDQCEFWGAFRVARRGRPHDVQFQREGEGFALEAWHDGYARLPGAPRHRRRFRWHPHGVLLVHDWVTATRPVTARTRLHLHPDCAIEEIEGQTARISYPGGSCIVCFAGEGQLEGEASRYFPEFGVARDAQVLCFTARGDRLETGFCIANGARFVRYDLAAGADVDGSRCAF
ncbi:MAG: alginate lyase family protein [Myxococcota bacterium]|nr:alginate lyase family protein [Myxococcota bacterium]